MKKASGLKPWQEDQALHAKATPEPSAPEICCIKGVESTCMGYMRYADPWNLRMVFKTQAQID